MSVRLFDEFLRGNLERIGEPDQVAQGRLVAPRHPPRPPAPPGGESKDVIPLPEKTPNRQTLEVRGLLLPCSSCGILAPMYLFFKSQEAL